MRITPSILKQHNKRDDAWSAFNGKVYNITPYLPFHPGGEKELMRVAGRDGTKLFGTGPFDLLGTVANFLVCHRCSPMTLHGVFTVMHHSQMHSSDACLGQCRLYA
jgi:hypothetical protein